MEDLRSLKVTEVSAAVKPRVHRRTLLEELSDGGVRVSGYGSVVYYIGLAFISFYLENQYNNNNNNNNKYLLEALNCTFFFRMQYIIIYVIISSKGLQIKINIFSMLSPEIIII